MSKWTYLFLLIVLLSTVSSESYEDNDYEEDEYEDVGDLDELFNKLKEDDYNDLLVNLKNQKESLFKPESYEKDSDESLGDRRDADDGYRFDDELNDEVDMAEDSNSEQFDEGNLSNSEDKESEEDLKPQQYYEEENNLKEDLVEDENVRENNLSEEIAEQENIQNENLNKETDEDENSEEIVEEQYIQNINFDEKDNLQQNNFNEESDLEENVQDSNSDENNVNEDNIQENDSIEESVLDEEENSEVNNSNEEGDVEENVQENNFDEDNSDKDSIQGNDFVEKNMESENVQDNFEQGNREEYNINKNDFHEESMIDEEENSQANNSNEEGDLEENVQDNHSDEDNSDEDSIEGNDFVEKSMESENVQNNFEEENSEEDNINENDFDEETIEEEKNFDDVNEQNIEKENVDEINYARKQLDEGQVYEDNVDALNMSDDDAINQVDEETESENDENEEQNIDEISEENNVNNYESKPADIPEPYSDMNDDEQDQRVNSDIQENGQDYSEESVGDENLNGNAPANDYDPDETDDEEFDDDNKSEIQDENSESDEFNDMLEILKMLGQIGEDNNEDADIADVSEEDIKKEEIDDNEINSKQNENPIDLADDEQFEQNPMEIPAQNDIEIIENSRDTKQELSQLTSEEINEKINDFIQEYNDDIIDDFETSDNIPINIKLSLEEAVVITSANYPEPYGGNTIVDWYFDGEGGSGIEFNITDFSVDGNSGDYLLVKPGQADDFGNDGIIFSYILRHERRYRFMDVDNIFVRFESKGNNVQNFQGFQFSVKFIEPKVDRVLEPEPLPEASAQTPEQTLSIHLAGFRQGDENFTEEFRSILVDMTTMYLNREDIQIGDLSLDQAVQITRVSACNINWPDHQNCSVVTFGIPLTTEGGYQLSTEQLLDLWVSFSTVDPAATRLRLLGVSRYIPVNEPLLLSFWWVLTFSGVLIVIFVGYSLFRSKCFKEYNGMRRLREDTDSIGTRKSNLSLYPTPHQNLSPMYADGKYDNYLDGDYTPENDTTRVDMGGAFTNKNFVRDGELMDLDSDEEIIMSLPDDDKAKRQTYTTGLRPKDVYDV